MIPREISDVVKKLLRKFPFLAILGPRQSGKTTLVRHLLPDYRYVNLELPDMRDFAETDPKGFLESYQGKVILDEVQHVPELFSYMQVASDEKKKTGEYVLTGSHHFLLLEKISQSLAGRVALLHLLPFSYEELKTTKLKPLGWESFLLSGGYPRLYEQQIGPDEFYPNYIQTYVERDVRKLINIGDLTRFRHFIHLMAGRIGQELNRQSVATDLGITGKTVEAWLSVLEASFILFRLPPYYRNFNKRVIKSPKIYFYDTGLACNVIGLRSEDDVRVHYSRGALFENAVIVEMMKHFFNRGEKQQFYFWKDSNRNEVDLLFEKGSRLAAVEIKSGKTVHHDFFKGLNYFEQVAPDVDKYLVYGGEDVYTRSDTKVMGFENIEFRKTD
jgi:uncharacterized protein